MNASTILGFLCLYNGLYIIKDTVEIGVKVTGKSIYVTYVFFMAVAVNFLLLFVLPHFWGLIGIALSSLISNIVLIYLTLFFSNRLYKIDFPVRTFTLLLVLIISLIFVSVSIDVSFVIKILISLSVIILWGYSNKNSLSKLHMSIISNK